ncbi:hypothetical protein BHE74_00002795 [Ensete ventricosum]|nr:hypothetical protein GW17_00000369 [Ensete ventricosum]RWW88334.1 hypothetical protein BHE74_00002795 [Ensete ventricosum]RZR78873.1 hypothetical protein BHM03_00004423 [Ensete ventricosum]
MVRDKARKSINHLEGVSGLRYGRSERAVPKMAAMAFPSTSLMASTPRLLRRPPSSLASSSSLFLVSGGGRAALAPLLRRQHGRRGALGCRCLFGLGVPELVVIAGVAALVFGPKKLPEIGRSFGKTIKSFQQVRLVRLSSILVAGFASFQIY